MRGYIHVYTGCGKGKTTAALGLSVRAHGAGKKIFFSQFVKGKHYSEIETVLKHLPNITLKQYGNGCFIVRTAEQYDIDSAQEGLKELENIVCSSEYDIIVMDELNIALYYNLVSKEQVINLLNKRDPKKEIIITGRYAPDFIIELADLVTEMKEIKHYYTKGVDAREGIEF